MLILDEKIVRNIARCKKCGDIIESKHRHDFVSCGCGALSIDGGPDKYFRVVGDLAVYESMVETEEYYRKPSEYGLDDEQVEFLKENNFPENGDWPTKYKVLFKTRFGGL